MLGVELTECGVIKLPAIVLMVVPNWVQTKEKKLERVAVVQKARQ